MWLGPNESWLVAREGHASKNFWNGTRNVCMRNGVVGSNPAQSIHPIGSGGRRATTWRAVQRAGSFGAMQCCWSSS